MVISQRLLNDGEHVVLSTRTHVKVLFLPAVVLIVLAALGGYLSSLPDGAHAGDWRLGHLGDRAAADRVVRGPAVPELAADALHLHEPAADHAHGHPDPHAVTTSR